MDGKIVDRRGQTTVWIIVAIIILASVILLLLLERPPSITVSSERFSGNLLMSSCIKPEIVDVLKTMMPRGGLIERHNTVRFNNEEVEYLCVNNGFYEPCVHQHPLLIQEMEEELRLFIEPKVVECFGEMEDAVRKNGGTLTLSPNYDVEVSIIPDKVVVKIDRDTTYKGSHGETTMTKDYVIEYPSGTHGLATVALEITAQEATYCYFESTGFSLYYPRYQIIRHQLSQPVKIYLINDTVADEYMMIAIRSCAMPAGF